MGKTDIAKGKFGLKYGTPTLEEKKKRFLNYSLIFCHTALLILNFNKKDNTRIVVYSIYSLVKAKKATKSDDIDKLG